MEEMGKKKMKLPNFLSKNNNSSSSSVAQAKYSSWPWPSCHQPRTLSFRTEDCSNSFFKTINNSTYNNNLDAIIETETPEDSFFSNSSESASFSTASDESGADPAVETVIRGLKSETTETERLFFEPGETSSILEELKPAAAAAGIIKEFLPFKESVVLSMESQDPYLDFRKSMEEMVEAHYNDGLKDWEGLQQLLCWYLKANGKNNHGYILGAFVDLLVKLASSSSSATSTNCIHPASCSANCSIIGQSPSSPLSFYTSSEDSSTTTTTPCVSSSLEADQDEIIIDSNSHCCLSSSLSEADQKEISNIKDIDDDDASSSS